MVEQVGGQTAVTGAIGDDDKRGVTPSASNVGGKGDDAMLVKRILAGDEHAFELLMRRHNQLLFRAARAIVPSDTDAEDVLQDAYMSAFRAMGRFEGRSTLATWLVRIVINEARTRARRESRIVPLETVAGVDDGIPDTPAARATGWFASSPRDPDRSAGDTQLRAVLTEAIDRLPESLRTVFILRCVEELDVAQTAECLGLSDEAVRVRLHRARAALREHIDRSIGEESRRLFSFGHERCDRVVSAVLSRLRTANVARRDAS